MVSSKMVSGSAGKMMDKFGGAATIRTLPITDRLAVTARIARENGKERTAVKLVERRIRMLLEEFYTKDKNYDAISAMAKGFGITEERVKEIAGETIRSQMAEKGQGPIDAHVILEAARVGKHYGLENEMKEAAIKYVEMEVQRYERRKACITLAQEEFGLNISDIRIAVENAMLSLMKRGLHDTVKSIAKDLDKQHVLLRVANQLLTDSKENGNYEFALSIDSAYGLLGYYQDEKLEIVKEICKKRCETGDMRYAIELAFKNRLPDQLKDAIISWLENTWNKRRDFEAYIRDCGSMLGEERIKEIAGKTVRVMLKGNQCEINDALPIATKYGLEERALAVRKIIRLYSSDVFSNQLSYTLDLAIKEGLTDETRRIGKMMVTQGIIFGSDRELMAIEQVMGKSGISYEDVQNAAKSAVLRMLKDMRYETAKKIAERYELREESKAIDEICGALQA